MSSPAHTWSDVINAFQQAAVEVLYSIGNTLATYANVIGTALIGLGVAFGIYEAFTRIPLLRGLLARFGF